MRIVPAARALLAAMGLLLALPVAAVVSAPAAVAAVGAPAVGSPLSAGTAAATDPLQAVANQIASHVVYLAPGYDGPAIDGSRLSTDIARGSAPIRIVGLPMSIANRYSSPKTLPLLLRHDSGFTGDIGVVTTKGFYATDSAAANNALAAGGGATAVVETYIKDIQQPQGATVVARQNSGGAGIVPVVVALLVVAALAAFVLSRRRSRRRVVSGSQDDLDSLRRRARAELSVLQAEYNDHNGTDASVQGVIDAAGELLTGATTAADVTSAEQMIAAARNQLNPGRVPPRPPISQAPPGGARGGGVDDRAEGYAVNRRGQVQQYMGAVPYGYQVVPPQYYGSITGNTLTDLVVLNALFDGGGGWGGGWGGGGGYGQGFEDGVRADQGADGQGGGAWDGGQNSAGGDSGGGNWTDGGSGGGDFGGGGDSGGGDFGGGDSGGGSW